MSALVRGGDGKRSLVIQDPMSMRIAVDSGNPLITYFGKAHAGTDDSANVWQVFRFDEATIDLDKRWADGDTRLDNVWSDRETLAYT